MQVLRVIVGVPVTWLWLAVLAVADYGEYLATLFVVLAALGFERAWAFLPAAALLLVLKHPAKWLLPEITRLQSRILPTSPMVREYPAPACAPCVPVGDLPVSVLVGGDPYPNDVEQRPQVLGC